MNIDDVMQSVNMLAADLQKLKQELMKLSHHGKPSRDYTMTIFKHPEEAKTTAERKEKALYNKRMSLIDKQIQEAEKNGWEYVRYENGDKLEVTIWPTD